MLSYLEKFNNLPADIRSGVSEPAVMQAISELEKKYEVNLASTIMKVMIKEIPILDLSKFFVFEHAMEKRQAEALVDELKNKVFFGVKDYLGIITEVEEEAMSEIKEQEEANDAPLPVQSSGFFFSSEDEEEVKELAQKLKTFKPKKPAPPPVDFEAVINKTKNDTSLSYSSDELNKRFEQILLTYLKGIRNKIDAKAALSKGIDSGGLGMKEIFADNVIALLDKNKEAFKSSALADRPEKSFKKERLEKPAVEKPGKPGLDIGLGQARDVDYDFKALANKNKEAGKDDSQSESPALKDVPDRDSSPREAAKESSISFKLDDIKNIPKDRKGPPSAKPELEEIVPPPGTKNIESASKAPDALAEVKPKAVKVDVDHGQKVPADVQSASGARQKEKSREPAKEKPSILHRQAKQGKVKMDDVKFVPKLTGPVDELQEMNLLNFRRLAADPEVAANKIKEKLDFLEDEGYSQRLKGIEAWRLSPLNKMYLSVGNESISNNKPIDEILEEKKAGPQDFITQNEFDAIMQLNKDLRF